MEIETLVETVQRRPVLYECNKQSYKDADKKNLLWKEVAEELGVDRKYTIAFLCFFTYTADCKTRH